MVRLSELVHELGGRCDGLVGADPEIRDVRLDSREVRAGDLFAALRGGRVDGRRHAADAVRRGALAILSEGARLDATATVPWWRHEEARRVAGLAAARVHGDPTHGMFCAGVTGTNGKTTTAWILRHLLAHCGRRPALVGTVGYELADGVRRPTTHTTPDAPELARIAARHRELGGDAFVLEVSSHALEQERIASVDLDTGIFTNLGRDHLDYHGTVEHYARAKAKMFRELHPDSAAFLNADDPWHETMAAAAREAGARIFTYGTGSRVDLGVSALRTDREGTVLTLNGMGISRSRIRFPLPGRFNVWNALAALACVLWSGASPSVALEGLATVTPPPGRLEAVPTGDLGCTVLVDYAHTAEGLAAALDAAREVAASGPRAGRVIVVFGAGGDRDREKRGPMGRVAAERADRLVVTSDNPRSEDPLAIAEAILAGARQAGGSARVTVELDRRAAIRFALSEARPGDVVLVAGKGHETTQTIGDAAYRFDDREVVREELP